MHGYLLKHGNFKIGEKAKFSRVDEMEQDMIQRKNKVITFIS